MNVFIHHIIMLSAEGSINNNVKVRKSIAID